MKYSKKILSLLMAIVMIVTNFYAFGAIELGAATDDTRYSKKYLQNGGFETLPEAVVTKIGESGYTQPLKSTIDYWDTTAYGKNNNGTQGQFEFLGAKSNGGAPQHFNSSSSNRVVAEGKYAAELNADENSTIYQRIETVSGSTYTWGLDHRGRDTTDTMVLFIGPEQYKEDGTTPIDPSKPGRVNKDQFVRMTDWLKTQYGVTYPDEGCSQKYTIYSKPFAEKGKFRNETQNEDENFSMTETAECNQEWNLWVISSTNNNTSKDDFEAVNGWSKYGTNCYDESKDSYNDVINGAGSRLGYDCTYTVPKGQTRTLFAFTSFSGTRKSGTTLTDDITYGNLLDDISFKLYQPISSSITEGGNGGVHTENAIITSDIQNGNLFYSTVTDGELCKIRTMRLDEKDKYEFQGAYVTVFEDDGTPVTRYIPIYDGDISKLTKEEKLALSKDYFLPDGTTTTDENGVSKTWDYYFNVSVESPVHIHMMYSKAPYVLYDSNGGEPYRWVLGNLAGGNLIGFRDNFQIVQGEDGTESYYQNCLVNENTTTGGLEVQQVGFYKSHDAVPNKNWNKNTFADGPTVGARFLGWAIKDSSNNLVILNGKHQVTYNPEPNKLGHVTFNNLDENGEIIKDGAVAGLELDATHGVTLTAQWQFGYTAQAQTLLGHALETQAYENSDVGGWVEETFINDRSNVTNYKDAYTLGRTERTDAYGAVGEKIIFRATPDAEHNYVFDGWYTIEGDTETLITTSPNLAISVEEGKSTTYYARFKTKTYPVVFHYSPSGSGLEKDYEYYDKDANNRYGKYFQNVVYNETAVQPKDDSQKVTMWFTSPTERDQEHMFNFSTQITKETHLYASPAFTFNYTNYFKIREPWELETYCTLKFDGNYIDMKTDKNISDYTIYLLKGNSAAEADKASPTSEYVRKNAKQTKKDSGNVFFDKTTKSGKTFNRAGVKYDNSYIYEMKKPVWVMFDFTYKGIKYTSPVKNRSLYNNIDVYKTSDAEHWFSTLPPKTQSKMRDAQIKLVDSIQAMYSAVSKTEITQPSKYNPGVAVSDLKYDPSTDRTYTFNSTTAIRNIEPWGLKYTFSVEGEGNEMSSFTDYGAVVFTDKNAKYTESSITVADIIDNENSVMFSKSSNNVYTNDKSEIEAYYINNMSATDFGKKTYVVFFVKKSNKTYYSSIVNNSYNDLATAENSEISNSIKNYSDALVNYFTLRDNAANQIA